MLVKDVSSDFNKEDLYKLFLKSSDDVKKAVAFLLINDNVSFNLTFSNKGTAINDKVLVMSYTSGSYDDSINLFLSYLEGLFKNFGIDFMSRIIVLWYSNDNRKLKSLRDSFNEVKDIGFSEVLSIESTEVIKDEKQN